VKAHIGILLTECANQLATRVVNEVESEEELVMEDRDVTQWEE
jgi:hypothetical protein